MKAIWQTTYGGPDVLRYEDVREPAPELGEVVIDVEAAGVHLLDTTLRKGEPFGPTGRVELPMVPGREVAGRFEGTPVVAHLGSRYGGYAERAVAATSALHVLAADVDPAEAVAMIGTGRTAMLLLEAAAVRADDVVVITSAAGGLGSLFVQAVRNAGATAYGLASVQKHALVADLGAVPVGYDDLSAIDRTPTLLLDGIGGDAGRAAAELLPAGGRVVQFGWSSGEPTSYDGLDLVVRRFERPDDLRPYEEAALAALVAGELRPLVTRFPLAEAAAAHAALEARSTTGKVVLVP